MNDIEAAVHSRNEASSVVMDPSWGGGWRRPLVPLAKALQKDDFERLGIRRSCGLGRRFNRRGERFVGLRRRVYEERFDELLREAGGPPRARIEMRDGFALDRSRSLPHLDALLAEGAELIERYGARKWEHEKPFLQNINPESAIDEYRSLLDFATSPDVVAAVAPTFGYVPHLSGQIPRGVRLMESSTEFDPEPDVWRESQLYHLDYHSSPTVYVVVALRDIGPDDGPLHFLGRAASRRVAEALGYGGRGVPYRLEDEQVLSLVEPGEIHTFSVPAGTVLFIESSACFHFGSRRPANSRYQMQYSFISPVRNDFLELWRPRRVYPTAGSDPMLRRLVLEPLRTSLD